MSIPDYQTIMLPLLEYTGDQKEHSLRETVECLARKFSLSEEDKIALLPSGGQTVFVNRVAWSKAYLSKAGLLESPRRSIFKITERGLQVLTSKPQKINAAFLKQFPEFLEFQKKTNTKQKEPQTGKDSTEDSTPEERLEYAYQELTDNLAQELLEKVKYISAFNFEQLVIDLLVKMGYGGSLKDAGQATRKSHDEGIDGIIKEDKLGLDIIYVQAKKWENVVGRPEIQKFVGALAGQGAKKGIFITTSHFSNEAADYLPRNDTKIVLIDGEKLAQLMIEYNLGVAPIKLFEIKKIDSDYFEVQ